MERVAILGTAETITPDMARTWLGMDRPAHEPADTQDLPENKTLAQWEREIIENTLEKHDGHRQKTAQELGIGVRTLGMKLKKWKVQTSTDWR
jgi:DNA-binding NtrC family response regulator